MGRDRDSGWGQQGGRCHDKQGKGSGQWVCRHIAPAMHNDITLSGTRAPPSNLAAPEPSATLPGCSDVVIDPRLARGNKSNGITSCQ